MSLSLWCLTRFDVAQSLSTKSQRCKNSQHLCMTQVPHKFQNHTARLKAANRRRHVYGFPHHRLLELVVTLSKVPENKGHELQVRHLRSLPVGAGVCRCTITDRDVQPRVESQLHTPRSCPRRCWNWSMQDHRDAQPRVELCMRHLHCSLPKKLELNRCLIETTSPAATAAASWTLPETSTRQDLSTACLKNHASLNDCSNSVFHPSQRLLLTRQHPEDERLHDTEQLRGSSNVRTAGLSRKRPRARSMTRQPWRGTPRNASFIPVDLCRAGVHLPNPSGTSGVTLSCTKRPREGHPLLVVQRPTPMHTSTKEGRV